MWKTEAQVTSSMDIFMDIFSSYITVELNHQIFIVMEYNKGGHILV